MNENTTEDDSMKKWAEGNFKALQKKIANVEEEMRNNKPEQNINVRKVNTDDGEYIVVEHKTQRWYSPNYFKKMIEDDSNQNSNMPDMDL